MFTNKNTKDGSWIESIPLPAFIEVTFHKTSNQIFELVEKQIAEIVENVQIHTQLRYSSDFVASLHVLSYIINGLSIAISLVIFAVIAMMIKGIFAQQESNIEKLSLLGAPYDYINKLYCGFIAKSIVFSSFYGFVSAIIIVISVCVLTENLEFFPYGFAIPSWVLYIGLPIPCLIIGLCMTYLLTNNLQKKHFACT
jgi:cell division protein FtsX